eukprot:g5451.t1
MLSLFDQKTELDKEAENELWIEMKNAHILGRPRMEMPMQTRSTREHERAKTLTRFREARAKLQVEEDRKERLDATCTSFLQSRLRSLLYPEGGRHGKIKVVLPSEIEEQQLIERKEKLRTEDQYYSTDRIIAFKHQIEGLKRTLAETTCFEQRMSQTARRVVKGLKSYLLLKKRFNEIRNNRKYGAQWSAACSLFDSADMLDNKSSNNGIYEFLDEIDETYRISAPVLQNNEPTDFLSDVDSIVKRTLPILKGKVTEAFHIAKNQFHEEFDKNIITRVSLQEGRNRERRAKILRHRCQKQHELELSKLEEFKQNHHPYIHLSSVFRHPSSRTCLLKHRLNVASKFLEMNEIFSRENEEYDHRKYLIEKINAVVLNKDAMKMFKDIAERAERVRHLGRTSKEFNCTKYIYDNKLLSAAISLDKKHSFVVELYANLCTSLVSVGTGKNIKLQIKAWEIETNSLKTWYIAKLEKRHLLHDSSIDLTSKKIQTHVLDMKMKEAKAEYLKTPLEITDADIEDEIENLAIDTKNETKVEVFQGVEKKKEFHWENTRVEIFQDEESKGEFSDEKKLFSQQLVDESDLVDVGKEKNNDKKRRLRKKKRRNKRKAKRKIHDGKRRLRKKIQEKRKGNNENNDKKRRLRRKRHKKRRSNAIKA